jgi:hypothetical protein
MLYDEDSGDLCYVRFGEYEILHQLGVSNAGHGQPLRDDEIKRLRSLRLTHLRLDIHFSEVWQPRLTQAIDEAQRLNVGLEMAPFLSDQPQADLSTLRAFLDPQRVQIATWLLFQEGQVCTPSGIAASARQYLGDYDASARFAGGTDAFFVQLNRERPALDGLDLLTYSLNPQVRAFDHALLVENLPAQAATLASAYSFSEGRVVIVSPVTLKPRYNPAAAGTPSKSPPRILPPQVDPRQASLFGADWTLGSIKYLSEGGAESVTYYETTGWLGVMEQEVPITTFAQFPSKQREVFPMFHVLADTGEFRDGEVLRTQTDDALRVDGLALRQRWR